MKQVIIPVNISAEEYQRLYQGVVRDVIAISADGRRIKFPANILRPFVTHSGVAGVFQINFNEEGRFVSIERLS